ncbi:MAG: hypothetical protein RPR97_09135 [Colwellia sp.]
MSRIDVIKEKINYLKVWLGIFVVTLIGLIGWIVSNYEQSIWIGRLGFSFVAVIWLFFSIHVLNKKILEKINSLEEL